MRSIILSTSLAAGLLIAGSAVAQTASPAAPTNPGAQPAGQTGAPANHDQSMKDKDKDKRAGTGQNASTSPAPTRPAAGSSSTGANATITGAGSSTDSGTAQTNGAAPTAPADSTTGR